MAKSIYDMSDDELRAQAKQNSANWAGSDAGTRNALHEQNVAINALLDSRTGSRSSYNPDTGVWSVTKGSGGGNRGSGGSGGGSGGSGGSGSGYSGAGSKGYDDNPGFDYGQYMGKLMDSKSTDYDYLERLLGERINKAVNTSGLGQYAEDEVTARVRDYISRGRQEQQQAQAQQWQQYYEGLIADFEQKMPEAPVYERSDWERTADTLAKAALDMKYDDWLESGQYEALADRWGSQGKLSMQELLGQISSRTGGLASSYATTAAQQQYNDYMAQLEDAARQMYAGERSDAISRAQLAYNMGQGEYQKYLDQLAQYNSDRSYAFDTLSQALAQSNYAQQWQNTLQQQELGNQRYGDETQYARDLEKAQLLAAAGDFSGYAALGYTQEEIARLTAAAAAPSGSGGSGGSGGGAGSGGGTLKLSVAKEYAKQGIFTPEVLEALRAAGYSDEYMSKAWGYVPEGSGVGRGALMGAARGAADGRDSGGGEASNGVLNGQSANWIEVPGYGRISWDRLEELLNMGLVREDVSANGARRYAAVR